MLLTTTPSLEGRPIRHYLGLVHGETILGANLFRDILAAIRDLIGGRARAYETTLERAREMALQELGRRARLLGADAVARQPSISRPSVRQIALQLDHENDHAQLQRSADHSPAAA